MINNKNSMATETSDRTLNRIARHSLELSYDQLPRSAIEAAKLRVIDAIGCALGAGDAEPVLIARRMASAQIAKRHPARLIGSSGTTTIEAAAFANTTMTRYLDYSDTIFACHPSDTIGGLLALAESLQRDGKDFLVSVIVAYDVVIRLSERAGLKEKGWDQGLPVAIAMAASCARLLQLPYDRTRHAVAIAAVANGALRATRVGKLSFWKGSATAHATRDGVFAALLAAEGMTGPERPFEGRHGVWEQITGQNELSPFLPEGGEISVGRSRLKFWPAEYNAQIAVWAALKLREEMSCHDIIALDLHTYRSAFDEIGCEPEKWDPKTRETADHSLPYIFARSLRDGRLTVDAYEQPAYSDPSLRPLMSRIRVHHEPRFDEIYPSTVPIRVVASNAAGKAVTLELSNPKGHESNPMNSDDVAAKFMELATRQLAQTRAEALHSTLSGLENTSDLSSLFHAMATDNPDQ